MWRSTHDLGVKPILCSSDQLRIRVHNADNSFTSTARDFVQAFRRRDQSRIREGHRLYGDSKNRSTAAVDTYRHICYRHIGKLRDRIGDRFLYRILRLLIVVDGSTKMKRHRQHACMFARTVVVQRVWLFTTFTEYARGFFTVRLVHAASECLNAEADLVQHRGDDFGVNRFTVVRRTSKSDFPICETKSVCGAGDEQRYRLK